MRASTAFRWSRAWLFGALALTFGAYLSSGLLVSTPEYGPSVLSSWSLALRGIIPVIALGGAWRSRELSEFIGSSVEHPRPWWKAFVAQVMMVAPVLWFGLGAYLLGLVAFSLQNDALSSALLSGASIEMHASFMATIVGWFGVGVAAGRLLPRVIGAPVVFSVSFLWVNWLPALDTPWTHQLAGTLTGCCTINTVPHPAALATAAGSAALGLATLSTLLIRRKSAAAMTLVAMVGIGGAAVGWYASSNTASDLYQLSAPRLDSQVCAIGDPTVCLWPEHQSDLARAQLLAAETYAKLCNIDTFSCPTTLSVGESSATRFSHRPDLEDWQVIYNVAATIVEATTPSPEQCNPASAPLEWHDARERLGFLAALRAGSPLTELATGYGDYESFASASEVFSRSEEQQLQTMASDLAVVKACGKQ